MANPKTGRPVGRPAGAVNKAKLDLASKAKTYADAALKTLATIAATGEQESSRVQAVTAILDRAYGRPHQTMAVDATLTALTPEQRIKQLADGTYAGG